MGDQGFGALFLHNEGVGGGDDACLSSGELGALDADFAIVWAGNHAAINPVEATSTSDDAYGIVRKGKAGGEVCVARAELEAGGAVECLE